MADELVALTLAGQGSATHAPVLLTFELLRCLSCRVAFIALGIAGIFEDVTACAPVTVVRWRESGAWPPGLALAAFPAVFALANLVPVAVPVTTVVPTARVHLAVFPGPATSAVAGVRVRAADAAGAVVMAVLTVAHAVLAVVSAISQAAAALVQGAALLVTFATTSAAPTLGSGASRQSRHDKHRYPQHPPLPSRHDGPARANPALQPTPTCVHTCMYEGENPALQPTPTYIHVCTKESSAPPWAPWPCAS